MGVETELKLLVEATALARVPRLAAVRSRKAGRARTRRLLTRYFDTAEHALQRAVMALRVRRVGNRWIQTVKSGGTSVGGLQSRGEWETVVAGPEPEWPSIKATPAGKVLGGARGFRALRPVFETDFLRTLLPLKFSDGSTAELCLDRGVVKSGARSAPISEIEIELIHGDPARLFEMAAELLPDIPMRMGRASKAERGHALAVRQRVAPHKAVPVHLRKDMAWNEALRCIMAACFEQLLANEQGMLSGRDAEYLHQMRVALRRMRSCLGVFRGHLDSTTLAPVEALLRASGRVLGAARDLDVLNIELLQPLVAATRHLADGEVAGALLRKARRARALHGRAAREFVASPEYVRGQLALGQFLLAPSTPDASTGRSPGEHHTHDLTLTAFAARVLQARHRRLRKQGERLELQMDGRGGAKIGQTPPFLAQAAAQGSAQYLELHRLRILAKKLRYAAEFFESLFSNSRTRSYIRSLSRLQDVLGGLNDCATGDVLLLQLGAASSGAAAMRSRQDRAVARAQGWLAARRFDCLAELPGRWADFREQQRFWKKMLPEAVADAVVIPEKDGGAGMGAQSNVAAVGAAGGKTSDDAI